MLDIQKKYINYLSQLEKEIEVVKIPDSLKENFSFKFRKESMANVELLIPIIGAFSAGKSSLINSFLGKNYLPVKLTPETALATELRYSDEEYIEGIKVDNSIQKFGIDEIGKITEISHQFKFLKMYINNKKLKDIEPLILVDMPGFESPLDLHNRAIMEYINSGVHYIVLTSVEDGTITRSMVRQLTDIQEYGRDFSFFLSKTNLRAKAEAYDIAQNVQEQIEEYFDIEKEVIMIDDNGGESLQKILLTINPEELFKNLFINDLKENYYVIVETINTIITSLGKDKNKNMSVLNELQESILKLQKERSKLVNEANERYSNNNINRIVESVGRELSQNLDEIVNTAIKGGQDAMSHLISEIARHALVTNIKESMADISNDIVDSYASSLSSLNSSMSEFTMSDNWLEKVTNITKSMLTNAKNGIDDIVSDRQKSNNSDAIYKVITTILATTTKILAPIIELVIIFLPNILGGIFKQYQQKKQEEEIRNAIMGQIIPSIKRELRSKLHKVFNEQIQEMINNISEQFERVIAEKKETIEISQKEINEEIINTEKLIESYKEVNKKVTALANNTLYKEGE